MFGLHCADKHGCNECAAIGFSRSARMVEQTVKGGLQTSRKIAGSKRSGSTTRMLVNFGND
ncbi:MAG TPA: hypothetical protein DCF63_05110 [Planctomycetaceae bacterium]|nr:hypothetical protein [Planctomycetaceae bacterium]